MNSGHAQLSYENPLLNSVIDSGGVQFQNETSFTENTPVIDGAWTPMDASGLPPQSATHDVSVCNGKTLNKAPSSEMFHRGALYPPVSGLHATASTTSSLPFTNADHAGKTMAAIADMRRQSIALDLTLVFADGGQLRCHRVVLAAASAFFHSSFSKSTNAAESTELPSYLPIESTSVDIFEKLLDYAYRGRIEITRFEKNLSFFYVLATFWECHRETSFFDESNFFFPTLLRFFCQRGFG